MTYLKYIVLILFAHTAMNAMEQEASSSNSDFAEFQRELEAIKQEMEAQRQASTEQARLRMESALAARQQDLNAINRQNEIGIAQILERAREQQAQSEQSSTQN